MDATQPAKLYRTWALFLVPRARFGAWIASLLILSVLLPIYRQVADPEYMSFYSALFLSGMVAYIIGVYAYIIDRSEQAFDTLAPLNTMNEEQAAQFRLGISHYSASVHCWVTGSALVMGFTQVILLEISRTGTASTILISPTAMLSASATLLVWLSMTTVISSVIRNAFMFYLLGRDHLRIDLLRARELVPLAWVSVISTLSLIGAQALFGLLALDGSEDWLVLLPGFLLTAAPMLPLFLLPIWSVHKRLQALKARELESIRCMLDAGGDTFREPLEHPDHLAQVNELLAYRREIQAVPEWPFDLGAVSRLALYLIIPPLTWVGAALIENLVDSVL